MNNIQRMPLRLIGISNCQYGLAIPRQIGVRYIQTNRNPFDFQLRTISTSVKGYEMNKSLVQAFSFAILERIAWKKDTAGINIQSSIYDRRPGRVIIKDSSGTAQFIPKNFFSRTNLLSKRSIEINSSNKKPYTRIIQASQKPPPKEEQKDGESYWSYLMLIIVNAMVFGAWLAGQYNNPNLVEFMYKNFTASLYNLHESRYWTLFTASISHSDFTHFLLNLVTFSCFGPLIVQAVGNASFLGLYLIAGFCASAASLFMRYKGIGNLSEYSPSLGASGATIAMCTVYSLVRPKATLLLFFIIPLPAWVCMPGLLAYDLWGVLSEEPNKALWDKRVIIDSGGHLAGALVGYLFWRTRLLRLRIW